MAGQVARHLDVEPVLRAEGPEVDARARELAARPEAGVEPRVLAGGDAGRRGWCSIGDHVRLSLRAAPPTSACPADGPRSAEARPTARP